MNKLHFLLVLASTSTVCAQTFEGIVRWKMSMEISDPALKAKMAEAERQMNSPETQAQLKEMEAKMNDPEMKKMMDQNPQMKAAMESQIKMMKGGGGGMDAMMPKGMILKVKGANLVTLVEGGMADGMEMLHLKDQAPVRINRKDMTYSKMPQGQGQAGPAPEAKVTKTSETMKLLGYNCTKYIVEITEAGRPIKQTMWATTEIKDIDLKALSRQGMGQGQQMFYEKVEGVPLRVEVASPQGNMVMEVTDIKREKLNDADFVIPAGFKEVKGAGF
jgi:TolA-binding protein